MNWKLLVLLAVCATVFCVAFYAGFAANSAGAYAIAGTAFTLFVVVFAAGVLDYQVGGKLLTLESKVQTLQTGEQELRALVSALLKSLYVLERGSSLWEGTGPEHYALVAKYLEPIDHLVADGLRDEVVADLERLEINDGV